jgi:hypothetical protein
MWPKSLLFRGQKVRRYGDLAERNLPMRWLALPLLAVVALAGCRAPTPSFNLLAPYGSSRVAPPSTSAPSTGGTYYNRTAPATGTGTAPNNQQAPAGTIRSTSQTNPGASFLTTDNLWRPVRTRTANQPAGVFKGASNESTTGPVQAASYVAPAASQTKAAQPTAPATGATASRTTSLQLNGMPVNDATRTAARTAEPARFQPAAGARDIAQSSPITAPSTAASGSGLVVSSAAASDNAKSESDASSQATSTLRWRSRGQ